MKVGWSRQEALYMCLKASRYAPGIGATDPSQSQVLMFHKHFCKNSHCSDVGVGYVKMSLTLGSPRSLFHQM